MKIVTVVGARPQFIKAAVVCRALAQRPGMSEVLLHTGQHYDANMADVFFSELEIKKPAYNLGIAGGRHGDMTGRMLAGIEDVLLREKPDWVLVYGDTNSTLAAALAAAKLHVPVAHVEAGLRSFNRKMPEEINRVLTDHAAELLFAPTKSGLENLRREGIADDRIKLTGDVMFDAALFFSQRAQEKSKILHRLDLTPQAYVLATIHRQENTDHVDRLSHILRGFEQSGQQIVLPLHPRTRKRINELDLKVGNNLRIIDPVGYLDMVMLEKNAAAIATDSGGVQKEAFFYKVPCVTLRDETEWVELVELGWNNVVPPVSPDVVAQAVRASLARTGKDGQPYGRGDAGPKIARALQE